MVLAPNGHDLDDKEQSIAELEKDCLTLYRTQGFNCEDIVQGEAHQECYDLKGDLYQISENQLLREVLDRQDMIKTCNVHKLKRNIEHFTTSIQKLRMLGALLVQRPVINGVDIDLLCLHVKLKLELADIDMVIVLAKQ